jgi:two-component sensor histidine kinase
VTRKITIELDARAPSRARQAIEDLVPEVDPAVVPNAKLLVSELVTNSVKYGRGPLTLELQVPSPDRLRCEVADAGGGFTPEARTRPATDVGGWGLYLVEALAESWGVQDGSTHVWFEVSASDAA